MVHYRGLTWEHPRGTNALRAAATSFPGSSTLHWDSHPLEGFESSSIEALAAEYDLIVLDHPHLGDAASGDSLYSLDELFSATDLADIAADSVGPSWRSYVYEGRPLALPVDAATQVSARRSDQVTAAPDTWDDVLTLSESAPVALSLAGPHAFLSFCSIALAFGEEPRTDAAAPFVSRETGARILDVMATLAGRAPRGSEKLNPIGLLELMATADSVVYCPLVYGYVNYSHLDQPLGRHPVTFGAAPAHTFGGRPGSTIGGTGIAVSRRCEVTPELLQHLRYLVSAEAQTRFIPQHDGQPSSRMAWLEPAVNAASNNFYRDTLTTIEQSWVRPRFRGFTRCQSLASDVVRRAIAGQLTSDDALVAIDAIFADALSTGARTADARTVGSRTVGEDDAALASASQFITSEGDQV
jgi:multiple sugar transport system substrate-binding protein